MVGRCIVLVLVVGVCGPATRAQVVQGRVDGVGFQTSTTPVLRAGHWCPVRVSLSSQGGQVFSGDLRLESIDLDGDRIAFTQPSIALGGDAGPPKRFWCYTVCNSPNELSANVELIGRDGALLAELPLPAQPPVAISNDDLLLLDLSFPPVRALDGLKASPGQPIEQRGLYRNIVVATMAAADLPDRWWGLEAVDIVIWDRPDPAVLSLAQRDALIEWVRNGGQLVIGIGPQWPTLRRSELAPILPLKGDGPTVEVSNLDLFFRAAALAGREKQPLRNPIAVTTAQPSDDAFRVLGDYGPSGPIWLVTMRLVDSGRVVASAAAINDLTAGLPIDQSKFFGLLFDLNTYPKEFAERQAELTQYAGLVDRMWLYDGVVQPIAFGAATALRGALALLFVAGYVALATVVSWSWLRRHGLPHLNWTVFAGFAVVASALSLGTVAGLRSLSGGVRSVAILDLDADTSAARGYCLFGYRSPIRQRADLSLAGDGNFLRPLAANPRVANKYVTPARYVGIPSRAVLDDVLIRATLKQAEGFWHGEAGGTIRGDLVVDPRTGRLTPASWIANDLNVELAGGLLVFIDPRPRETGMPWRAAGLTSAYELSEEKGGTPDLDAVPPAINVLVLPVGRIPARGQLRELGQEEYARVDANRAVWLRQRNRKRSELLRGERDLPTLWHAQQAWAGSGPLTRLRTGLGDAERMLLLASTRNYFLHNRGDDFKSVGTPISTDGLPDLDVTHWLLRGQAVFITWAYAPGPPRLLRNGKPLDSVAGLTAYRVRLPLYYGSGPPEADRGGPRVLSGEPG